MLLSYENPFFLCLGASCAALQASGEKASVGKGDDGDAIILLTEVVQGDNGAANWVRISVRWLIFWEEEMWPRLYWKSILLALLFLFNQRKCHIVAAVLRPSTHHKCP